MLKKIVLFCSFIFILVSVFAQKAAIIRGNVYDRNGGQPVPFANVVLRGSTQGATTDLNGFFQISNVKAGDYTLFVSFIGYDSLEQRVNISSGEIAYKSFYLDESAKNLEAVEISARREERRTTSQVSKITVTQKDIKSLPSTGGEPDIAQYLTVIPGVLTTGDQGGQIYIRGGSPVQNKILLDGMTIYSPFHSIGFFSIFETETIRSVDVLTGGFNAEYGGRVSAVVDLKTREGNKTRLAGLVSGSPFQAKALLEGPILKLKDGGSSVSVLVTGKKSLLPETSKTLYKYASQDSAGLPFGYEDIYGKISLVAGAGSRVNIFGFNFSDAVNYTGIADLKSGTQGYGANFTLVPTGLGMIVGGSLTYSNYDISLNEGNNNPRTSKVGSFSGLLDFTIFGDKSELKYGAEISGFSTNVSFYNPLVKSSTKQEQNTTEIAGFVRYRRTGKRTIIEPSLRIHSYTSLGETVIEPRFSAKFNASDRFRFKFSGGMFSQNLISTVSEKDVVNLFVGFLSGPEENFFKPGTTEEVSSKLQKAIHAIGGFEFDVSKKMELNVEAYYKNYTQLVDINRTKVKVTDNDYVSETGAAYGLDLSAKYNTKNFSLWATFSRAFVNRYDGFQTYSTNFDRRNNMNLIGTWSWGRKKEWEFAARWNYGSGFPFTQTKGFYSKYGYEQGVNTDVPRGNADIGIIYSNTRNGGRLPDYHRMDLSFKRAFTFTKNSGLDVVVSATNTYDRDNIFYFNRVTYSRVNQLPILPSVAATFKF
ncbi:MAG: TonB-dependent receptor [Saprospiraceae bacterium]|nr:TonB-dependent receptor [Saprospiraceae bacterium]